MGTLSRSALVDSELVWLLTVNYAGRPFFWSSRPCAPVDDEGTAIEHDGGLDSVELEEAVSGPDADPDSMSLPFEVFFPADVSVAELAAAGHDLAAATGELALWVEGTPYSERQVVLVGRVSSPEYGDIDEPVSFSLEEAPWEDASIILAAAARVTSTTWPTAPEESLGQYYPYVFGCPGRHDGGSCPGSPGIVVTVTAGSVAEILIKDSSTTVTQVTIRDPDGFDEVFSVTHVEDGLGRTVAIVDVTSAATVDTGLVSGQWWVIWDQNGDMKGAGDLLVELLSRSSLQVDLGAWAAQAETLNPFELGGYIDDPCSAWDYIVENIYPLLPLDIRRGPDGLYPVCWRYDAQASEALEHIVEGPGVARVSPVESGRQTDVVNLIRFEYAKDPSGGAQRRRVITGEPDPDNPEESGSYFAQVSQARYGVRELPLDTDIVWTDATAGLILSWMIQARCAPIRSVSYQVDQEYAWMPLGGVLLLTSEAIALDEQVVLLGAKNWIDETTVELRFKIAESLPRDRIA